MASLDYRTAGESHGQALVVLVEGFPAGVPIDVQRVPRPRPGHADLAGSLKWLTTDCRAVLERASARETAARVAAGALSRCLLREFGIEVLGYVVQIHDVMASVPRETDLDALRAARDANEAYCPDPAAPQRMIAAI